MAKKLTAKQEKFVRELVKNGGNAAAAYRVAYNAEKMKPSTVEKRANELKNNGVVTGRYKELMKPIREKEEKDAKMSAERIIEEYTRIVNADIMDFFEPVETTDRGTPILGYKPKEKADTRAIKSIKLNNKTGEVEGIELYDKMAAVSKLERIFDVAGTLTRDSGIKIEFGGTMEGFAE